MELLLDTHTFLWFIGGNTRLSIQARESIEDLDNERFLSIASLWEIAIKVNIGKMQLEGQGEQTFEAFVTEQLKRNAINMLPITIEHLAAVAQLPRHHGDPFDRLIIAQAQTENFSIIGADVAFDAYDIIRLW
jgi:PIN domain nuclease of toxin-antitoxin system